jgi:protein-tyrosine phosphatase
MMLVELPFDLPGRVFSSPMPFSSYDPHGKILDEYRCAGVRMVVILAEQDEILQAANIDLPRVYAEQGMKVISVPIPDFGVPRSSGFSLQIFKVIRAVKEGCSVAVHCHGGRGRTGLFLACMAKQLNGMPADQAIQWVREFIPEAVETQEQVRFVQFYPREGRIC